MNDAAIPPACLNCGEALDDLPRARRFCPACGQETNVKPPRLAEFLQQFGGAYFSTEGALWRTLRLLLTKPGELTRLYLLGRRKHYVLPLRLYLTISVLVLLALRVAGNTGAVKIEVNPGGVVGARAPDKPLNMSIFGGKAGMQNGQFFCSGLPAWTCERLKRRIDLDPKDWGRELEAIKERFLGNLGSAMFLLLPSFALWLKLVYWNRRMRYTEHLVFALHVHAFWFVALAFTLPDSLWLSVPAFTAVPWYTMLAMRRVYGGRRWPRFLRAGVVSLLYVAVMGVALAFLGLWVMLV